MTRLAPGQLSAHSEAAGHEGDTGGADMTMPCGRARRLLWPDETPRVVDPALAEARAHLTDCRSCQAFVADMERMASLARTLAPRPMTPPPLRDRLVGVVTRELLRAKRDTPMFMQDRTLETLDEAVRPRMRSLFECVHDSAASRSWASCR